MMSQTYRGFAAIVGGVLALGPTAFAQPATTQPVTVGGGTVQSPAETMPHSATIFVVNRLGESYQDKVGMFEDLVVARFTDLGFTIASPDDAAKAIASAGGRPTELDKALENEASRLALARNLGTDYLVVAGLNAYDQKEVQESSYGTTQKLTVHSLTATYKILERNLGASLKAGEFTVSTRKAESNHVATNYNPFNELARKAAGELAKKLEGQLARAPLARPEAMKLADFTVNVRVQDFTVPNIVRNDKGEYEVSSQNLRVLASGATIVLDGAAIGSAPGLFKGPKGMHKMRISRDGCRTWEENVTITDRSHFDIDLQLTNESIARFKEMGEFLQDLKSGEKITDATAEKIRGFAQMLRQSGYKVDAKEAPTVHLNKVQSLWNSTQE